MAKTLGIDISTWQRDIDFKKVKADGYDFVIIRAGFGRVSTQKDNMFESHYKAAKAAGLKIGIYHYSYATSVAEAKIEAAVCLDWIKGKTIDLPVYIDMEESSVARLGKKTCTAIAKTFCEAVKAKGYKVGVYANLNWFTNYLDYEELKKLYSIWLAQYNVKAQLDCDIWQNSSTGRVDGYNGDIDTNYCYVDFGKATTTKTESKPTTTTKPAATKPAATGTTFKKGDKVKVKNAITYDGKKFDLYYKEYDVIEVSGDRVVIGIGKEVTAAVKASNLAKVTKTATKPTATKTPEKTIKVGGKVKVTKAVTYDGQPFTTYYDHYDVIEVNGDRVVIGIGKTVTAAVKKSNLKAV